MSGPELSHDDLLAAEYVLGLLEGEPLREARERLSHDLQFAEAVKWWESGLAPLLDGLGGADPGPELWGRIEAQLGQGRGSNPGAEPREVVELRRRVRIWRTTATMALAASVAALVFALTPLLRAPTGPATTAPAQASAPPLLASIPLADTPLRLAVTYIPDRRELLVSANGVAADGVHDHELWLVPPEGAPKSLGIVKPGGFSRVSIDASLARDVQAGRTLALTREPLGGKPADRDAGPIVGTATLSEI